MFSYFRLIPCHVKPLQEMAAKHTTMWKCKDVETPGEPGRIRKRLFIDLENDDKTSDNQPPPSKKAKRDADQQKQEPLLREHLGRKWYLVITVFQGETKVHLRVYEQRQEDDTLYPTRKGIALDLEKWKKLSELKTTRPKCPSHIKNI